MQKQFDEQTKATGEEQGGDGEYAYKSVVKKDLKNRRTVSVISLILAVLSIILLAFTPWVGLVFALLSVGAAIWSRKNLGYFDKISLASIIIGIFGVVFALSGIIFGEILAAFF